MTRPASFVLFPLGGQRFALPSELVTELARPDRLHTFPHTTARVPGVLVRRGRIVPVMDIAELLVASDVPARRFYLIAKRSCGERSEWTAIPVTGECELLEAEVHPVDAKLPAYMLGELSAAGEETVLVVDLEKLLAATEDAGSRAPAADGGANEARL